MYKDDKDPPKVKQFRGIDNVHNPDSIIDVDQGFSFLTEAENVDVSSTFHLSRRAGFSLADGGNYHSLWSNPLGTLTYAVKDDRLVRLTADLSAVDLYQLNQRLVSYADTGAGVYLSNGQVMLRVSLDSVTELSQEGTYDWPTRTAINPDEDQVYYDAPPPGNLVVFMFGRLWVVRDEGIFFSPAYQPEFFDLRNDYIDLPGVKLLGPVDDGIYIGTPDGVYFLAGGNPNEPGRLTLVSKLAPIARTQLSANAKDLKLEGGSGKVLIWETDSGKVIGLNGGQVIETTSDKTAYPGAENGASFLREVNGQTHIVTSMPAPPSGEGNNMRATDIAVAEVRRNGIII